MSESNASPRLDALIIRMILIEKKCIYKIMHAYVISYKYIIYIYTYVYSYAYAYAYVYVNVYIYIYECVCVCVVRTCM